MWKVACDGRFSIRPAAAAFQVVAQYLDEGSCGVPPGASGAVFLNGMACLVRSRGSTEKEAFLTEVVIDTTETLVAESGDVGGLADDAGDAVTDDLG